MRPAGLVFAVRASGSQDLHLLLVCEAPNGRRERTESVADRGPGSRTRTSSFRLMPPAARGVCQRAPQGAQTLGKERPVSSWAWVPTPIYFLDFWLPPNLPQAETNVPFGRPAFLSLLCGVHYNPPGHSCFPRGGAGLGERRTVRALSPFPALVVKLGAAPTPGQASPRCLQRD